MENNTRLIQSPTIYSNPNENGIFSSKKFIIKNGEDGHIKKLGYILTGLYKKVNSTDNFDKIITVFDKDTFVKKRNLLSRIIGRI